MSVKSEIGIIGLGVMGKGIASIIAEKGITLSVFNRHVSGSEEQVATKFVQENTQLKGIIPFDDLKQFVDSIETPRKIIMIIKAGAPVDDMIDAILPLMQSDDVLVDAGNSHFRDTMRRSKDIEKYRIHYMGTGISGGKYGVHFGPSIMIGGSMVGYSRIGKILENISSKDANGKPCCIYMGPGGAGHFVKMAHNGIEYADMQIIAETYFLMRFYAQLDPEQIADAFDRWRREGQEGYLLEITSKILRKREDGEYLIDKVLDCAHQKGTGGWTIQASMALGTPVDTVCASVMARYLSGLKSRRVTAMSIYDHTLPVLDGTPERLISELFSAYAGARIVNHAMCFDLLRVASEKFGWSLNLSDIARIWTSGCVIQSELMESLVETFEDTENDNLLLHPDFTKKMKYYQFEMASVISESLQNSYPVPVLSAGLNYYLGFINGQSSANLIQAQRNFFGSHAYQRTDQPENKYFHSDWTI